MWSLYNFKLDISVYSSPERLLLIRGIKKVQPPALVASYARCHGNVSLFLIVVQAQSCVCVCVLLFLV